MQFNVPNLGKIYVITNLNMTFCNVNVRTKSLRPDIIK
ncbi:hypothetical protein M094_0469 [Bacteroides uniformis str. 3978 T3 ii]|uniref:Uncharacterized protein n=1 Tax=Bacteroides uniformis str. 3978 T3 ii TaxID=1339349 RepID=A0A078S457_BACUN|nr:hypothetical protein M094_0469 [Bacteroides uniformis str. 3978 T3 ii]